MSATDESPAPDLARLGRARDSWEKATKGKWRWNCAGEILVDIDGVELVIGTFQGSEADAAAVCRLHNSALSLFELAGVPAPTMAQVVVDAT